MYKLQAVLIIVWVLTEYTQSYKLQSKYDIRQKLNLYPASFALASHPIINMDGLNIDIFIGASNGSIIATSLADNMLYSIIFNPHPPSNAVVKWMQWTDIGLIIASNRYCMIIDQYNITQVLLTITPNKTINFASSTYCKKRNIILIALSIQFTIQIYENQTLVLTLPTNSILINSMQLSKQGQFLYYIDNYKRFVINIETRQLINSNILATMQHGAIATAKNSNISASINLDGTLIIWNNQQILSNYQNSYLRSIVTFTQSSQKLITYIYDNKSIHIRQKDQLSDSNWQLQQELVTPISNQILSIKTVDENIYVLGINTILVYSSHNFSTFLIIIIVIAAIVFVFVLVITVVFLIKRNKQQVNINTMDQYYRLNSEIEQKAIKNTNKTKDDFNTSSYFKNQMQADTLTPQNCKINS